MTPACGSTSSKLQMLHSGSLALARWPQSSCPYPGSKTAPRRGTVASTSGRHDAGAEPGGGGGTLVETRAEAVAGAPGRQGGGDATIVGTTAGTGA